MAGRGGRPRAGTGSGKRTSTQPRWTPGHGTVSPVDRRTVKAHVGNRQLSPNQKGREKGPLSRPFYDSLRAHALCQVGSGLRGSALGVRVPSWGCWHTPLSALSARLSKREAATAGDLGSGLVQGEGWAAALVRVGRSSAPGQPGREMPNGQWAGTGGRRRPQTSEGPTRWEDGQRVHVEGGHLDPRPKPGRKGQVRAGG